MHHSPFCLVVVTWFVGDWLCKGEFVRDMMWWAVDFFPIFAPNFEFVFDV